MPLEIVTETNDYYLTTTGAVKEELGLASSSSTEDARIDNLIRRATDWVERQIGYPPVVRRYRETVAGYGQQALMLSRTPVRSVVSVFYGTDTGTALQLLTTEFDLDADAGLITRPLGFEWSVPVVQELDYRPMPGEEFRPWLIEYIAGWTYGGLSTASGNLWSTEKGSTSTGRTLPFDIEEAVIQRCATRFTRSDTVQSKKVGDLSITYATDGKNGKLDDPASDLLIPWRRVI